MTQDVDNLLNLLCREEESLLPVKGIPESMSPEQQKMLQEVREKIQVCYSISKTLKQRFQEQKLLIKKAQDRIKKQLREFNEHKEYDSERNEEQLRQINALEKSKKLSDNFIVEANRKIAVLQVRLTPFSIEKTRS